MVTLNVFLEDGGFNSFEYDSEYTDWGKDGDYLLIHNGDKCVALYPMRNVSRVILTNYDRRTKNGQERYKKEVNEQEALALGGELRQYDNHRHWWYGK